MFSIDRYIGLYIIFFMFYIVVFIKREDMLVLWLFYITWLKSLAELLTFYILALPTSSLQTSDVWAQGIPAQISGTVALANMTVEYSAKNAPPVINTPPHPLSL